MKKIKGIVLAALSLALMVGIFAAAKPAQAATKVPSSLRHSWYMTLPSIKDPSFIKFTSRSIDVGDKSYHNKISGSNLQVIKKSGGWYEIGYKGITNPTYRTKKIKIGNTKRTVLLKKYSKNSHYADVFLNGKKVKLLLQYSSYFLG
ncbi:hypothetical protein [Secundilactobacillus paracollinoides]|nr:hypothetical protein [Secundilactobacillus paracollinoides]ANZ60977.1 hypothetical protein AYR61_06220 [Secundilactobacillus paracollinoides]